MIRPDAASISWLIVTESHDAVIAADRQGVIILWNRGAEEIFGYAEAEALGASLDLIIPETLRERHWEGYQRVMQTGRSRYGRELLAVPGRHRDGRRISLEFSITLLQDPEGSGEVWGTAAILRDVTVRWERNRDLQRRLADLEARLQHRQD